MIWKCAHCPEGTVFANEADAKRHEMCSLETEGEDDGHRVYRTLKHEASVAKDYDEMLKADAANGCVCREGSLHAKLASLDGAQTVDPLLCEDMRIPRRDLRALVDAALEVEHLRERMNIVLHAGPGTALVTSVFDAAAIRARGAKPATAVRVLEDNKAPCCGRCGRSGTDVIPTCSTCYMEV